MAATSGAPSKHEHWSSHFGFLMAAIGSAVGLGNFWRFPFTAGENGGGAFVLIYLLAVIFIALPAMMGELSLGRKAGLSAPGSYRAMAKANGTSTLWGFAGWIGVIASFTILSYYSVIAGWIIYYFGQALAGTFVNISAEQSGQTFDSFLTQWPLIILFHAVFIFITTFIVSRGIQHGVEAASKILMPTFFALLLIIVFTSLSIGDSAQAISFLFSFDFSKITIEVVISAVGQAFFSIGVGAALMITYGAYLDDKARIPRSSVIIAFSDSSVALLAGLAIFPIVFQYGLEPAAGAGLLFVTLPVAFGQMPLSIVVAAAFFFLAFVAALTSAISLLEVVVSRVEERGSLGRRKGAIITGILIFVVGIPSALSFNWLAGVHPLEALTSFKTATIFDIADSLASNILLPIGGILSALFVGWIMSRQTMVEQLGFGNGTIFGIWRVAVQVLVPAAVFAVLVLFFYTQFVPE